jgi:hypothetical protein
MRKKPRLTLVSNKRPAGHVFDDLEQLRRESATAPTRRERLDDVETFARIPHDRGLALYKAHHLSSAAWAVLIELDRIILKHRGQNPVLFVSSRLREIGLNGKARTRALRQLEKAGVVQIKSRGPGLAPWIAHSWYPIRA